MAVFRICTTNVLTLHYTRRHTCPTSLFLAVESTVHVHAEKHQKKQTSANHTLSQNNRKRQLQLSTQPTTGDDHHQSKTAWLEHTEKIDVYRGKLQEGTVGSKVPSICSERGILCNGQIFTASHLFLPCMGNNERCQSWCPLDYRCAPLPSPPLPSPPL